MQLEVYVSEHLSLRGTGKAAMKVMVANRTREIRPSGMTWGACGNVGMTGAGLRPIGKPMDKPPYPKRPRAPHFYPDGAAGKAANLTGESPVPSIARFGRLAYLMHAKVTTYVLLRCKRHGRPERRNDAQRWERPGWQANSEA